MIISGDNCCLACIFHNCDEIINIYINRDKKELYKKTIEKYNLNKITKYLPKNELSLLDKFNKRNSNNIYIRRKKYQSSKIEEIFQQKSSKSLIVVVDQVTDQNNLGNIIRTSVLMGVDGIVISEHSSAKLTNITSSTSAGAIEIIKHHQSKNLSRTIEILKKNGYWIYALDTNSEEINDTFLFDQKSVLILGNEGKGIRQNILQKSDYKISIPQLKIKGIDSYNVANSLAIALHHYKIKLK